MRAGRMVLVAGAAAVALATAACVPLDETTGSTTTVNEFLPEPTTTTVYVPPTTAAPPVTLGDDEIQRLALEMTWDKMSMSERGDICDGVNLFGLDTAAQLIVNGSDGEFTNAQVEAWLLGKC